MNVTVQETLLKRVRKAYVAHTGSRGVPRRCSAFMNVRRSMRRVLVGLGRVMLEDGLCKAHGTSVYIGNPKCMATRSVVLPPSVRVISGARRVTGLARPVGLYVRLRVREGHKCHVGAPGGFRRNDCPVSTMFVPIQGTGRDVRSCIGKGRGRRVLFVRV